MLDLVWSTAVIQGILAYPTHVRRESGLPKLLEQMPRPHDPLADPAPLIRRVYSYAAYRLGDGVDAEDATSATLERALRYRRSYDRAAGTAQAWLLAIARRVVDDQLARERLETSSEGIPEQRASDERLVERLALRQALTRLSEEERELLALRYGADLPAREIALVLGTRVNTTEVAIHRALAKLREQMDSNALVPGRNV